MPDKTWTAIAGGPGYGAAYQSGNNVYNASVNAPYGDLTTSYVGAEGPSAVINDWTGGCASQTLKELYLPAQGGHNGFYNTTIYALKLTDAVPSWSMVWEEDHSKVLSSELGSNPPAFSHSDGNPRTVHGWFHTFCDNNGRLWITAVMANPSGDWATNTYSVDRNNLSGTTPWMYHGRLYSTIPGGSAGSTFGWQGGAGAFDPTNNKIWKRADFYVGQGVASIDCATAVAAGPQNQSTGPQVPGSTYYDNRDVVGVSPAPSVITTGTVTPCWIQLLINGGPRIDVMDLNNPTGLFFSPSASGTGSYPDGAGAVWHRASNAVLVYDLSFGANIGMLKLSSNDPRTASYGWSTVTPAAGNTATPATDQVSQFRGLFSKVQLINDMGNGQSALVAMCGYRGSTYVYKLPLAGV
jgi:hypothetical protein